MFSVLRVSVFALLILAAGPAVVLADSCPYCGRTYGDGAPGDEGYIASIRAAHEAECPWNPANQPATGGDEGWSDDSGGEQWQFSGYGVVTIFNNTSMRMPFLLRARGDRDIKEYAVEPGSYYFFYDYDPASFTIWFDGSYEPGSQEKSYDLPHNTVNYEPTYRDGREYAFNEADGGVDLHVSSGRITEWAQREDEEARQRAYAAALAEAERNESARRDDFNRGMEFYNAEQWGWAVYFFKKSLWYGPDSNTDYWIAQAEDKSRRWKNMVALTKHGNKYLSAHDWPRAIDYYTRALANYEHALVRSSLERAHSEKARHERMLAANGEGNKAMKNGYFFSAAIAYSVAVEQAVIPEHRKKVEGYLKMAKQRMNKRELEFFASFSQEERYRALASMMQGGEPVRAPTSQPKAPLAGTTGPSPQKPTSIDIKGISNRVQQAIDEGTPALGGNGSKP